MENPLLRKPSIPSEKKINIYKRLGLRENPFPLEPGFVPGSHDPRLNGDIYCEYTHEKKKEDFLRLLVPTRDHTNVRSIAFLMDFASRRGRGIGKTAFLNQQQKFIMQDFGEEASERTGVIFAVHIIPRTTPPCRKFWEFCKLVVESLLDQRIIQFALWRLRGLSGEIPENTLQKIDTSENWEATIGNDIWLSENKVNVYNLIRNVEKTLVSAGIKDELSRQLANYNSAVRSSSVFFENFSDFRWRKEGGDLLFNELVKLFLAAQFTRGLLLIDEVEKIVYHQNTQERRAFVESLRYYMLDGDCANARNRFYGSLLTIHPGIQEILLSHWKAAGLDRLAPLNQPEALESTIYFEPLNEQMALPLISVYLDYYRLERKDDGDLSPFEEDALIEAIIKSGGVPGQLLRFLHRVIEKAAEGDKSKITKKFINKVFDTQEKIEPEKVIKSEAYPPPKTDLSGKKKK